VSAYGASSTRRRRRTREQMVELREAIYDLVSAEEPMTCRQVFYRLVSTSLLGVRAAYSWPAWPGVVRPTMACWR
jgi:hypothetical protein